MRFSPVKLFYWSLLHVWCCSAALSQGTKREMEIVLALTLSMGSARACFYHCLSSVSRTQRKGVLSGKPHVVLAFLSHVVYLIGFHIFVRLQLFFLISVQIVKLNFVLTICFGCACFKSIELLWSRLCAGRFRVYHNEQCNKWVQLLVEHRRSLATIRRGWTRLAWTPPRSLETFHSPLFLRQGVHLATFNAYSSIRNI